MKFTIDKAYFLKGVQAVMKAVSAKTPTPILTGIKVSASEKGVVLTGSDANTAIEYLLPVNDTLEVITPGDVVVPSKMFGDMIKKLPKDKVSFEVSDYSMINIKSGKSNFKLNGMYANDYPKLEGIKTNRSFSITEKELQDIINKVSFAVSKSETRPALTGVLVQSDTDHLLFVATDSHRLARKVHKVEVEQVIKATIPGKSIIELGKLLNGSDSQVDVCVSESQIVFKLDRMKLYTRLIEGNYPDTSRLIPGEGSTVVEVETKEILDVVERALLLTQSEKRNVIKMTIEGEKVEINATAAQVGSVTEDVVINNVKGENMEISFNPLYMKEALKALNTDVVKIEFLGKLRPFVIRNVNDNSVIQLLVPIRTY